MSTGSLWSTLHDMSRLPKRDVRRRHYRYWALYPSCRQSCRFRLSVHEWCLWDQQLELYLQSGMGRCHRRKPLLHLRHGFLPLFFGRLSLLWRGLYILRFWHGDMLDLSTWSPSLFRQPDNLHWTEIPPRQRNGLYELPKRILPL